MFPTKMLLIINSPSPNGKPGYKNSIVHFNKEFATIHEANTVKRLLNIYLLNKKKFFVKF